MPRLSSLATPLHQLSGHVTNRNMVLATVPGWLDYMGALALVGDGLYVRTGGTADVFDQVQRLQ